MFTSLFKKIISPESTIVDTFFENSDNCARSRRNVLFTNVLSSVITPLSSGIYFTSLMLAMGASESYIGYVTAILSFSGLFQVVSPLILEKLPRRKGFLITARILYYFLSIVVIGVTPLLPVGQTFKLVLFFLTVILMNAFLQIASPGLSSWHIQSLPETKRGGFYAATHMFITVLSNISSFLAGLFLDKVEASEFSMGGFSPTITAILILRAIALLLALTECYSNTKIKEFPYETKENEKDNKGLNLLSLPLRDKTFMLTILPIILWSLFTGTIGQYFNIYLIEDIKMSYTLIASAGLISVPVILLITPVWFRLIRKIQWPKILAFSYILYSVAYICNGFITKETEFVYFICIILGAVFMPGISNIHSNLVNLNMPEANRSAYFSCFSIVTLLATFMGNYLGIQFIEVTKNLHFNVFGFDIGNKQYISWLAAILVWGLTIFTLTYLRKKENRVTVFVTEK
ncbi:MAG: MFS transporter [Clostridia bacterium]|nr:MFS transporter [Clostridia bacterium]